MVTAATVVCICATMLLSLVLPMAALRIFAGKNKKQGIVSAWLLGAAGFFVTQILIRLPILTVLQMNSAFMAFAESHLFVYAFGLAFTAGLFELAGRFAVAKLMRKNLNRKRSLAAGLGHGGIEAIFLVGTTYASNLIFVIMINSGYFDYLIAQTAGLNVDVSQLELIRTQLVSYSPAMFLLGGYERILAMAAHVAMSMLVCYGVAHKKALPCALLCLLIHTCIDLTAGLMQVLPQNTAYIIIYSILTIVAAASLWIIKELYRRWKEDSYDSEE